MSRKAVRQQVGVALFPFLAVLICTMGALIVLLVLLVQQARVDASTLATRQVGSAAAAADVAKHLRERLEEAQWKREMLDKSRMEKTDELADSRAKLAHFEEHAQRLAARVKELLAQAHSIDEGKTLRDEDLAAARAEAARRKTQIERRTRELEAAKQKTGDGREWYALIPYQGAAGTRRRPIYVECTEFGVLIQPEGILLRAEDFSGPLGPGNPLDVALRAIREHIERTAGSQAGQPYPLLVVRPNGILAYGAARSAMKGWDDEFGYELISDEKQLDFGQPDPALSATLAKTVAVARQRQAAMVAMTPRRYQGEEPLRSFSSEPTTERSAQRSSGGVGSSVGPAGQGRGPTGGSGSGPGGPPLGAAAGSGSQPSQGANSFPHSPLTGGGTPGTTTGTPAGNNGGQSSGTAGAGTTNTFAGGGSNGTTGIAAGSQAGGFSGAPAQNAGGNPAASSVGGSGSSMSAGPSGTPLPSLNFGAKKSGQSASAGGGAGKSGASGTAKRGSNWALPQAKLTAL
jgi:hypothetical protein